MERQNNSSVSLFSSVKRDRQTFPHHGSSMFREDAVHNPVLPYKNASFKNPLYSLPRMYWKLSGNKQEINCLKCVIVPKIKVSWASEATIYCLLINNVHNWCSCIAERFIRAGPGDRQRQGCLITQTSSNLMQIRNVFIVWWELWIKNPTIHSFWFYPPS